jgi:osmoprotectant transport system substrate-binding protein
MRKSLAVGMVVLATGASLVACGKSGSSGSSSDKGCTSAKGNDLVTLNDDKHLQLADNIIPAVNAAAATPALLTDLGKVSDVLTTKDLVSFNTKTDIDRKSPSEVADAYVSSKKLTDGLEKGSGDIKIGITTFNETQTLANIYQKVLSAAGFHATLTTPITNREAYEPALSKGDIQAFPEYAATLTEFLNGKQNGPNAATKASPDLDTTVQALTQLGDKAGLKFGKPAAKAQDTNAFAVTKAFAQKNHLKTLSDVASKCNGGKLVLGGVTECKERPFCMVGLQKTYGIKFSGFQGFGESFPLIKTALKQGKVQVGLVLSSDAGLSSL